VDGLSITRDPINGLISDTALGSVTNHRTYDSFGRLATYEAKYGATSIYSVAYTRDSLGRIESKAENIQGTTTAWGYSYDSAGRLWQVMRDGLVTAVYAYDSNGNRLSKTSTTGAETGTYDDQDRLLTYGKWAYTYTANGELRTKTDSTNGAVTTFTYDGQGNLRRVDLPDGRVIEYVIDGDNRRVGKKVNGTLVRRWLYRNQLKPAAELDGAGTLLARYVDGLVIKGSNTYKIVADQLGTPKLLVDRASGAVAQRLDFDEFGMVENDTAPGFQMLGFAGGIYDPDTGLVRFGARDYEPETGRWTAKDPIRFAARDSNLYRYVAGNPVNSVDPTGLDEPAGQNSPDPQDGGVLPDPNSTCMHPDECQNQEAAGPGRYCLSCMAVFGVCTAAACATGEGEACAHLAAQGAVVCAEVCKIEINTNAKLPLFEKDPF